LVSAGAYAVATKLSRQ